MAIFFANALSPFFIKHDSCQLRGGYLDFSHPTELKNISIAEIYMKKQYKSSIIKSHKIIKIKVFHGVPLKGYVASKVIFRFCARNQKQNCGNTKRLMTLKFH